MTNIQDLMISAQVMVGLMQRLILHISLVSFLLECLAARLPSDTWALIELLDLERLVVQTGFRQANFAFQER